MDILTALTQIRGHLTLPSEGEVETARAKLSEVLAFLHRHELSVENDMQLASLGYNVGKRFVGHELIAADHNAVVMIGIAVPIIYKEHNTLPYLSEHDSNGNA